MIIHNCFPNPTTNLANSAITPYKQVKPEHFQEWLDSAVNPEIIGLNVESLQGTQGFDYILYSDDIPRRNDGRVTDAVLNRYRHLEEGGWYCSGIDPLTGQASDWGCLKPDQPYIQSERKGFGEAVKQKLIKYEHPFKTPTELFCLRVPLAIWQLIGDRHHVPLPENIIVDSTGEALGFWQWVIENPIPILITEGAKKAGALLSQGHAAIALPGIYNGYRAKDKDGIALLQPQLIPQLTIFCQQKREFVFCFDQDKKPQAAKNVQTAIAKTGKLLKAEDCTVTVITWDLPHKGIDDLILAKGQGYLEELYDARRQLERFQLYQYTDLSGLISQRVNVRYLGPESDPPSQAQLLFYQSPKGTGKTEKFAQAAAISRRNHGEVLNITHREQLGQEQSRRLGIPYRSELGEKTTTSAFGYSLCIDSLHPYANPPFNPDDWQDCDLFIDEIEQVIWHLLNSPTCQRHRVPILQSFSQLVNTIIANGGHIWCGDADLTRRSIDYVVGLLSEPIKPWLLVNEWQPHHKRLAYAYPSSEAWLSDLMAALENGDRLMIHTAAQKVTSRWGTINLESLIQKTFPHLNILRIDRESVADPMHPAYGCIGNLNETVRSYDVVIASPTLETGVSIEGDHFHRVFCNAGGKQTVEAVGQSAVRVRANIPRHIFINKYSSERIGNGSHDPRVLLATQKKAFTVNAHLLGQTDAVAALAGENPQHLKTWATFAASHNYGFKHYRELVYENLEKEGYQIMEVDAPDDTQDWKDQAKQVATDNYNHHCQAVSDSPILNNEDYQRVRTQRTKTEAERMSEQKTAISQRYLTEEVTPDLIKADDQGLYGQLQIHYYLTVGNAFLKKRDQKKTENLAHEGKVFTPDYNHITLSAKIKGLEALNIQQFFDPNAIFTSESLKPWFQDLVLPRRRDIKTFLNQTVNTEKDTAIGVAQRILKTMNLQMTCVERRRVNGKITRFYALTNLNPDDRNAIFDRWLERDSQADCDTPSINNGMEEMAA